MIVMGEAKIVPIETLGAISFQVLGWKCPFFWKPIYIYTCNLHQILYLSYFPGFLMPAKRSIFWNPDFYNAKEDLILRMSDVYNFFATPNQCPFPSSRSVHGHRPIRNLLQAKILEQISEPRRLEDNVSQISCVRMAAQNLLRKNKLE